MVDCMPASRPADPGSIPTASYWFSSTSGICGQKTKRAKWYDNKSLL